MRPFNCENGFRFEVYNEVTILLVSYCYIINIELVQDASLRYNIGWVAISIIITNFIVNLINVIIDTVYQIKELLIKLYKMIRCKNNNKE